MSLYYHIIYGYITLYIYIYITYIHIHIIMASRRRGGLHAQQHAGAHRGAFRRPDAGSGDQPSELPPGRPQHRLHADARGGEGRAGGPGVQQGHGGGHRHDAGRAAAAGRRRRRPYVQGPES